MLKKVESLALELGDKDSLQKSHIQLGEIYQGRQLAFPAPSCDRPEVLLAAKTYGNDPLKPAVTVDFYTFEGRSPILAKTVRRCKA